MRSPARAKRYFDANPVVFTSIVPLGRSIAARYIAKAPLLGKDPTSRDGPTPDLLMPNK